VAKASPLILLLLFIIIMSSTAVELWQYRDAPGHIKLAILAGAGATLLLAAIGLPMLGRRLRV